MNKLLPMAAIAMLSLAPGIARSQAAPDSVAMWTRALASGTMDERETAAASLASFNAVPSETQGALISELRRLNAELLAGASGWNDGTTSYYTLLVEAVAKIPSTEARMALLPAIGMSSGISRRVARLGDAAVPTLLEFISRPYEADPALTTLGFAWFWSDSTGAPLSDASRASIVRAWNRAASDTSFEMRLGAVSGVEAADDAALLPLAQYLARDIEERRPNDLFMRSTTAEVVQHLAGRASQMPTETLALRIARAIQAMCADAASGERLGYCNSLENGLSESARHLLAGRGAPASNVFAELTHAADRAMAQGVLTPVEHAVVTGSLALLAQRLPPA